MKTKSLAILLLFAGALVFTSCSKYEEGGPMFSKKGTLAREWTYDDFEAFGDNDAPDEGFDKYEAVITFTKEGDFDVDVDYTVSGFSDSYKLEGIWEFVDDKAFVRMVFKNENDASWTEMWKIIKLKKTELIVEDEQGDRYTYVSE